MSHFLPGWRMSSFFSVAAAVVLTAGMAAGNFVRAAAAPATRDAGETRLTYLEGARYLIGDGVKKDRRKGMQLITDAARAGDLNASVVVQNANREAGTQADFPVRAGEITTPVQAAAVEKVVERLPADLGARIALITFYRSAGRPRLNIRGQNPPAALDPKIAQDGARRHYVWLIEHCPDAPFLPLQESGAMTLNAGWGAAPPPPDPAIRDAWTKQVMAHQGDAAVMSNAGACLLPHDRAGGLSLLGAAFKVDSDNPLFRHRLLGAHRVMMWGRTALADADGDDRKSLAADLLKEAEAILDITAATKQPQELAERVDLFRVVGMSAVETGDLAKARSAAEKLAAADAQKDPAVKSVGFAGHYAAIILGRVALREGKMDEARAKLQEAGKSVPPGARRFNFRLGVNSDIVPGPSGPDVVLAKEMLEKGERDAVIAYFAQCEPELTNSRADIWIKLVRAGKMPHFTQGLEY